MRWDPPVLPRVLPLNSSLQTTAHTLWFSFALLALYPDEQERLYQHIEGVLSSLNGMPVSSRNLNSFRANITRGVRRHEPFHAIISVSSPGLFTIMRFLFSGRVFYESLRLL
jgi:cytochrome P450